MRMKTKELLALLFMVRLCEVKGWKRKTRDWDAKEHSPASTCSNLTQVLDNWKFAIMTQVKDLLVNDHASVLPEYNRIQPLSDALGDLYKQFNSLKEELGGLTAKFDRVEAFVDDLQAGKIPPPQQFIQRLAPRVGLRPPLRARARGPEGGEVPRAMPVVKRGRRLLRKP
ncbi:uncharacterized protein si:dkey-282h22.5 [Lampris incognitus]|uniref:uncharacterized protein si:dkey-282h22.5 n=1 Tax=Lampris incognitus TaxID=2546036 RepID=UPI0024B578BD|nr:uncharacterized protein si:dkey-282h22.5 [Lampris incognitus]XP_056144275.1 uncharacterized protein si:dkey-282h22.5 [Lampris incognitus]